MIEIADLHLPPHHFGAEQWVLSCFLLDNDTMLDTKLKPKDFYTYDHELIFAAMWKLFEQKRSVDVVTVSGQLWEETLDKIWWLDYLYQLAWFTYTIAAVKDYEEIVLDRAKRRKLQKTFQREAINVVDWDIDQVIANVYSVVSEEPGESEAFNLIVDSLVRMCDTEPPKTKIGNFWYSALDRYVGWYQEWDVIVVWARPSIGKSTVLMNLQGKAMEQWIKTVLFSVETSSHKNSDRFVAMTTWFPLADVKKRTQEVQDAMIGAFDKYNAEANMYDNIPNFQYIVNKTRKEVSLWCKIVYIDYLQLIKSDKAMANEAQEIAEIARRLHSLAVELKICIVLASQLNRQLEWRVDKKPNKADLKASWGIEEAADIILMLYDPSKHDEYADDKEALHILIVKNRDWPTWEFKLTKQFYCNRLLDRVEYN